MDANQIQNLFASNVRQLLVDADLDYDKLYEIRLRVGRPLFLTYDGGECFLRQKDTEPYLVTREDLKETLEYVSGYSLYAYEDEIRQGFLSVQGGHRVGVTGKVILDGNRIRGMKYISCINVRLAHEIQGCAEEVLPYIQTREQIMHTLIVSPPRCGKTTLLRDIIRQMSNGWGNISGVTVGVVDERSELAGCYQGIPQNDLGMRTDILDGCPKAEGMQMLIRSMSPVVLPITESVNPDKCYLRSPHQTAYRNRYSGYFLPENPARKTYKEPVTSRHGAPAPSILPAPAPQNRHTSALR